MNKSFSDNVEKHLWSDVLIDVSDDDEESLKGRQGDDERGTKSVGGPMLKSPAGSTAKSFDPGQSKIDVAGGGFEAEGAVLLDRSPRTERRTKKHMSRAGVLRLMAQSCFTDRLEMRGVSMSGRGHRWAVLWRIVHPLQTVLERQVWPPPYRWLSRWMSWDLRIAATTTIQGVNPKWMTQ